MMIITLLFAPKRSKYFQRGSWIKKYSSWFAFEGLDWNCFLKEWIELAFVELDVTIPQDIEWLFS